MELFKVKIAGSEWNSRFYKKLINKNQCTFSPIKFNDYVVVSKEDLEVVNDVLEKLFLNAVITKMKGKMIN